VAQRYKAVYRGGKLFAEYVNGELTYLDPEYRAPSRSALSGPMVIRDIGEYRSTIDGSMITSRNQHRDHMRAHDVVEVGNEPVGSLKPEDRTDRELGYAIKRRLEEVQALPQDTYDNYVRQQAAEHAQVAALATATP
jgi:hypothetical protein